MSVTTSEKPQAAVVLGYSVASVISRIMALDVDAAGNGEKAAWKRYLSLSLLAIAKGWDKRKVVELTFGKSAKPSKTFQNMWTLANKARGLMIGNANWADIKLMAIDEAQSEVLAMINRHMATLECTSKNEYDKYCNLSPTEAADSRTREANETAAAKHDAKLLQGSNAATTHMSQDILPGEADAKHDRTPSQIAISVLTSVDRGERMTVVAHIVTMMTVEDMILVRGSLNDMIANVTASLAVAA